MRGLIYTYFYAKALTYVILRVIIYIGGEGMTKRELEKILKNNGWRIVSGARHDMAIKDGVSTKIPIPRHKGDIPIGTAKSILRAAGAE